jgi:hypothetical protein
MYVTFGFFLFSTLRFLTSFSDVFGATLSVVSPL